MMPISPEEELKALDKSMVRVAIIDALGVVAIGLGVFVKMADDPARLHPVFADPMVSTGLLALGGAVCVWGALQIIAIARRRSDVLGKLNG